MCADVFISYATENKRIADDICGHLEANTISCWMAPRDIDAGSDWPEAIHRSIRDSRAMVVVFTAEANDSRHMPREIALAIDHDVRILPFKLSKTPPGPRLEYLLKTTQWVDGVQPPRGERIRFLAAQIRPLLSVEPVGATTTRSGLPATVAARLSERLQSAGFSINEKVQFEGWTFPLVARRDDRLGKHRVLAFLDGDGASIDRLRAFAVAAADEAGEHWVTARRKLEGLFLPAVIYSAAVSVIRVPTTTLIAQILEERPFTAEVYGSTGFTMGAPAVYDLNQGFVAISNRKPRLPLFSGFSSFANIVRSTLAM
jgi:TIR domain